jgi:hypothetical protein
MEQSESYALSKPPLELKDENIDINILNQTNNSNTNTYNNSIISQSNGSIRTTEVSSESDGLISKTKLDSKIKKSVLCNKKTNIFNNNIYNKNNIIDTIKKGSKKDKSIINSIKNKKAPKHEEYKSDYLNKSNSNINAPKLLFNYNTNFKIDNYSHQDEIGTKEFIKNSKKNNFNVNNDFKKISIIPNEVLSHLCTNENFNINQKNKNYNEISVTQRYKHKLLTIVYLSPVNKI